MRARLLTLGAVLAFVATAAMAGAEPAWAGDPGGQYGWTDSARKAGVGVMPSGAGTSRRGLRWCRQAAVTHRSATMPSNRPRANMAATAPTGTATTPNTTGGTRWRVAV
jgi:hypothetical protein